MKNRKEIHGFELAVSELVVHLDALLAGRFSKWESVKRGLNIEIEEVEKSTHRGCWSKYALPRRHGYWRVEIYPVGWPLDSSIVVIFEGPDSYYFHRWRAVEGFVHLRELHRGSQRFINFEVLSEPFFCVVPKDLWTTEGEILTKTLRAYLNEGCASRFKEYLTTVVMDKLRYAVEGGNSFLEDFWGQISDTLERAIEILKPQETQREEG